MRTVEHSKAFSIGEPIDELFPLFSPEGERRWVPGWDYENLMGTTRLSEDYVFLTRSHVHGSTEAVWIVKSFDPENHAVTFYKVEPGDKLGVVSVRCVAQGADETEVHVTYKYLALSPRGERFVSEFTAAAYERFIGEWRTLLEEHFRKRR